MDVDGGRRRINNGHGVHHRQHLDADREAVFLGERRQGEQARHQHDGSAYQ